uniref:Xylulose kinase-1 n=1 Tax=Tanacetum cinerariifolium TaxID=118510 RepID=A0A6L2JJL3_TANCI|nr:hypothetical protein [Tanacetum cinerariifolium]
MALTFVDTHNMIAYLTKSDASEGFDQIIDFLNASAIKYALIVNPNIYVSCIKQFWSSVSVKKVNDETRLQALIDREKVIITETTVREALRLDDAKSIDCLPNEEIFTELSRMGYEKPSTKLTFYKAFFSQQWKFLIHTILQCISAKRTSWNEFSSSMASAVICLSTGMIVAQQADDVADEVATGVDIDDVPASDAEPTLPSPTLTTQPPPPPQELPSTSQVIPTPPPSSIAQPLSPPQQPQPSQPTHDAEISLDLLHTLLETCTTLTRKVEALEQDKVAQALEIIKLKQRVKNLERKNKLKVSGLRRLRKVGTTQKDIPLEEVKVDKNAEVEESADVQGRPEESQAQIYKIDLEHTDKLLSMQDDELEPAKLKEVVEVVTTAKLTTEVVTAAAANITAATTPITAATITTAPNKGKGIMVQEPKPLNKKTQIEQDEAYARELEAELNKNINWDDVIEQVQRKEKEDNVVLRYQVLKRKPQTKAQAKKNMMIYLRNMVGFKMDYFKGMSYDDIRLIFEKYFNLNVSFLEKTKEQLEEEESRALKRTSESLEEKAAKKQKLDKEVHVVDYEIYTENNKPYYKIIRANGTHLLFLSFLSILRNFDREDLKPYVKAQVWKNQRGVYGLAKVKRWRLLESCGVYIITLTTTQMILLVERRYPLTSFGVDAAEDFKENMLRD